MKISSKTWSQYMMDLKTISNTAATKFAMYIMRHDPKTEEEIEAAIEYAYALATKYGEGASEMACQMYDAVAEASGKTIPPAVPAKTSSYGAIKRTVRRAMEKTQNPKVIGDSVGCEVKRVSLETIKQNAARDGAEFAWIPGGDTCSFCLALAANGWQKISKKTLKAGHKDHIHANCDCTYAVRFDENTEVEGYYPEEYRAQWDAAEGNTSKEKIRFLDRKNYAANRDAINAQKRAVYEARKVHQTVANNGKNSIMYRKRRGEDYIEPMPRRQLMRIVKAFRKNGGVIQMSAETDDWLRNVKHVEAITLNAKTILLMRKPGRASVFEELIHTTQFRNGKNDGSERQRIVCEIEAKEKLLKYQKAYKLTEKEVRDTKELLARYKLELVQIDKGGATV